MWFLVQLLVGNRDWSLKYVDHFLPLTERISNLQEVSPHNHQGHNSRIFGHNFKYVCRSAHVFFLSLGQVSEFDDAARLDRLSQYYLLGQSTFSIITRKQQQNDMAPKTRYCICFICIKLILFKTLFFQN